MAGEAAAPLSDIAPAKVNLSLHVLGRRPDGYHDLESLVAFADVADSLTLAPGAGLSLDVSGPTAPAAGPVGDNLVIKAATALAARIPGLRAGAFRLIKSLPAAAGLGGGSSDAAAALRLLAGLNGVGMDDRRLFEAAQAVGADVPVCLAARPRMMRGAGERLGPALELPAMACVLVNPGVPVETAGVFRALGLSPGTARGGAPHAAIGGGEAFWTGLAALRNDLEAPATALQPVIADALLALRGQTDCRIARMSGSGATCFGLFGTQAESEAAARALARAHPGWWVRATTLGAPSGAARD